jgi:hypothetical protein
MPQTARPLGSAIQYHQDVETKEIQTSAGYHAYGAMEND